MNKLLLLTFLWASHISFFSHPATVENLPAPVDIPKEKIPAKEAISHLQEKHETFIFYLPQWIEGEYVNVTILELSLDRALSAIGQAVDLSHVFLGDHIVFLPSGRVAEQRLAREDDDQLIIGAPEEYGRHNRATLSGKIVCGSTGEGLIGAVVYDPVSEAGASTDLEGRFEIELPTGTHRLRISYVGYESSHQEIRLYQDWLPARVLLQSGESVEVASLRYNGYHNTVVWRHPKTHSHIRLDDQLIKEFSLDHPAKTARFVRFQVPGSIETILAESLFDEDVRLLARRNIEQTDRVIESYEGTMVSVPVLEPRPEYYVINAEGEVTRISRLNRRNLQNAFPGNERNIRQLLRQHSLRIQNETELLEAVHLINEVLTKEGG